ncbi:hypothetical protein [Campylobacter gastrosuis]|uniref:Uncharacterized protein n=1 Tax=Campylobacter gastrosuis TaxID=2974576 RepID=A0ABT7HRZ2_9BACT|nr:hypothetical protein [Campylobacter gastrosuis]MDL0089677.1 hypothetical protein [Campylobacter gastrosuis]
MAFKPNPYHSIRSRKYICKKCGYSEVVLPTSDEANEKILGGIFGNCPKCGGNEFENKRASRFDIAITLFFQNFRF